MCVRRLWRKEHAIVSRRPARQPRDEDAVRNGGRRAEHHVGPFDQDNPHAADIDDDQRSRSRQPSPMFANNCGAVNRRKDEKA